MIVDDGLHPVIPGFGRVTVRNGPMSGTVRYISDDERFTLRHVLSNSFGWYWLLQDHRTRAQLRLVDLDSVVSLVALVGASHGD